MAEKQSANTRAEPMTYERFRIPSLTAERARAAAEAGSMSVAELQETAERLQINTGGATRKKDLVAAVQDAPRGTDVNEPR